MESSNKNAAAYFIDRHRHGEFSSKPAFIEADGGERQLNYGELAEQSDQLAHLYERHGLRRDDRAAMLVLDTIEFPVIFWGSLKAGVIPVPLNTLLSSDVYKAMLLDSRARALFVSSALFATIEPILNDTPDLKVVFIIGADEEKPSQGKYHSFAKELSLSEPCKPVSVSADECAFWLYSSGSTGAPKGVRHVHGSLQATSDTYGAQVLGIQKKDIIFSVAKMFFAYGLGNAMTFPLSVGATTVLFSGRPTPDSVFAILKKMTPTIFCGVPTLYAALLSSIEGQVPAGLEKIRCCISAGEALPEEIGLQWQKLTDVEILDGVGSTEMLHIFLSNSPGDVVFGTSGVAVPGYEIRLVDDVGNIVGPGTIGELLVKGSSAADSYWNQRDKSRTTFEGEWTHTGDKYEMREDGRMIYCGRTDDMFKVSGIWVSPFEIEQALVSHPLVLEAAVVAARDENDLEKPKAFVVLKSSEAQDDLVEVLKSHVKDKIGKWKYPRWIEVRDDLPKTATGKIQRFKLRDQP